MKENCPTETLPELAERAHRNNFFEFGSKIVQQKLRTAIGTNFAPTYASIFVINFERGFLKGF